jgi:hypothetical protein
MACLAFANLPLSAAFRRGSERRSIAGQEVHCSVGLEFDQDLKRPVVGLMDLHLDPYRDINLPDESFSS